MDRPPGLSVRLKLTLSYAGFLMVAGFLMLVAAWMAGQPERSFDFLLRYVPDALIDTLGALVPGTRAYLLRAYAPAAAMALAFLLVFGLAGGWILAGRMLAPLIRITDAARVATNGSLSHRIHLPGRRDEFRELADAFDTMLAQLDAHIAEQRRFAANASHELRTPLTITQTLLDVARNDPNPDTGELVERLRVINRRAIDLTEALLLLSRADQRSFSVERVDLSLIAEEATETLLPGTVWVATSIRPEGVVLTVENTGETLAPGLVATLVEPFQRGTERVRTDHAGVGLGLAIVRSIARAHDGTLTLTPRPGGGLRISVQLPAAPNAVA
jgi:two-component system sensor histidine kinase VanS